MQETGEGANGSAFKDGIALRATHEETNGLERSLTFHHVGYQVSVSCGRRTKQILDSCSGIMRPGLNAVMGPTGSGKTTLLDVLADRKGKRGWSGVVLVNGRRRPKNFKCVSGYVVQDDLMMGSLSVRENLQFSAALRLPSYMTRQQRRERVEKVISELGLESCAKTKIGSEFFRGVSGGERKRTSIGMELIIEPEVLFLDEPTTGLDAHTAVAVVQLLKRLSQSQDQRIIILSIHQPRYSIFSLFTSLTLLSQGQLVYHGDSQQILPYFEQLGYQCGQHENPADFILDVLTACEKKASNVKEITLDLESQLTVEDEQSTYEEKVDMADKYRQTKQYQETNRQLEEVWQQLREREQNKNEPPAHSATYARNIFWQALVVTSRSARALLRDPITFYFQVIVMMIFALLVGVIYFDLDGKTLSENTLHNVISDRSGAFFFMIMNQVFSNMSAVDLFIRRKALFIHENASGFYRVSVFFFSQIVVDLIAKRILPVLIFCIITYFMIGLRLQAHNFFIYLLTMFMVSVTAATITYAYSSIARVTAVGTLLSALTFVLSMLFGGFFIALSSLPDWLRWIKYLSLFRYGLEALSINELRGQQFHVTNTSTDTCIPLECIDGTEALRGLGYETAAEWIWYDQIALATLSTIFLTICFCNLQLIKKHK